jgi:hypothetical protein
MTLLVVLNFKSLLPLCLHRVSYLSLCLFPLVTVCGVHDCRVGRTTTIIFVPFRTPNKIATMHIATKKNRKLVFFVLFDFVAN